jgi:ABC-type Fe3+ transport system permease subunit
MVKLGTEIEQASWAPGAGPWHTYRHIVLPLISPAVVVVGVLTFATAIRAASIVALLVSDKNKPLSLLQLEQMVRGDFGETSVIGVLLVVLVTDVALVARVLGLKVEAGGVH